VNDNSIIVGDSFEDIDLVEKAFFRWSNATLTYYQRTRNGAAVDTFFTDRNDAGATIGVVGPFALASGNGTPFMLKNSNFTPLTMTIAGQTHKKFTVARINNWGTTVGMFKDSSGNMHGFKRYSDGTAIPLNYPGAVETSPTGINDHGTIVGWYSKKLPPNESRHGFIYHNGQWASVNFPNSKYQTMLEAISNSNLILATTVRGSNALNSYIYVNGKFKKMVMPQSSNPTYAFGVSLKKNLITGFSGFKGYIATCN
jgi:hypothetical protein